MGETLTPCEFYERASEGVDRMYQMIEECEEYLKSKGMDPELAHIFATFIITNAFNKWSESLR